MFEIGGLELLIIALVALLVLGPEKLPHAAAGAARLLSNLRRAWVEFQRQLFLESTLDDRQKSASARNAQENGGNGGAK